MVQRIAAISILLFVPERNYWINFESTSGWNVASQERDGTKTQQSQNKCKRIRRPDAEQYGSHHASECHGGYDADGHSDANQKDSPAENQSKYRAATCTQGNTNADLTCAVADGMRHDAVDSN